MVKARKYVLKKHFNGFPKREDYEIIETELPPIQNGEILVKAEWVGVDPYIRAYSTRYKVPYDQFGYQVGIVEDSRNPKYPVGTRVVSHIGWRDYGIINPNAERTPGNVVYKLPQMKGLPSSLGVGAMGMPGATAYFGLLRLCDPKPNETVVVTGAAGAVGSLVGQIAKIKGCRVIGFAGSDDKVRWLEEELGFDRAFNYKTVDVSLALKESAPKGVDCYFDNVGGEISSLIIRQMNDFGRVAACGSISSYNDDLSKQAKAPILQVDITIKQLKLEGFIVTRWIDKWHSEAFPDILRWIQSGKLKTKEHITEGFDKIFDAFIGMLTGDNVGKAVVKII